MYVGLGLGSRLKWSSEGFLLYLFQKNYIPVFNLCAMFLSLCGICGGSQTSIVTQKLCIVISLIVLQIRQVLPHRAVQSDAVSTEINLSF